MAAIMLIYSMKCLPLPRQEHTVHTYVCIGQCIEYLLLVVFLFVFVVVLAKNERRTTFRPFKKKPKNSPSTASNGPTEPQITEVRKKYDLFEIMCQHSARLVDVSKYLIRQYWF